MPATVGYSGTPLPKKLGFKEGSVVLLLDAPKDYKQFLGPVSAGVRFEFRASSDVDIAHVFVTRRSALQKYLAELREVLKPEAPVWVSWPKKKAKVPTDITEDTVRELALPLGFVDIKVCAVTDIWSGLKLVVRKQLR
jgi:hypothetical protein